MEIQYRKDITSIYDLKESQPNLAWILKHFLFEDNEVLYFVSNEELKAVVSIGDLFRCLEGKKKDILNTDFTWVQEKENEKAFVFFLKHPTVHELPVIDETWNSFRLYAKSLYYDEEAFYMKTAEKFMEYFRGIVLLADLPDDDLAIKYLKSNKEKEDYIKNLGREKKKDSRMAFAEP